MLRLYLDRHVCKSCGLLRSEREFVSSPVTGKYYGGNLSVSVDLDGFDVKSVTTYRRQVVQDGVGDQDFHLSIFSRSL